MKYYIIAGEASGDIHGASLINELKKVDSHAEFRVWGGDHMAKTGATLVKHYRHHAIMGLFEVIKYLQLILRNLRFCKQDIQNYQPDVVILIDYPGFNLKIAKYAHTQGLKVFYYISPKIWAWKSSRAKQIKKYVDRMFVILPFEKDFYNQYNYPVEFVGNPIIDYLEDQKKQALPRDDFLAENHLPSKPIIALLPGSRSHEIKKCLPEMTAYTDHYPEYQFVIAGISSIDASLYTNYTQGNNIYLIIDQTHQILQHAEAAIVTSGTAALETALYEVPQVVCYKISRLTYLIGKMLIKVRYITLVNLIMNREIIPELIQNKLAANIKAELDHLIYDSSYRKRMLQNYQLLKQELGGPGASKYTAQRMYDYLTRNA